MSVKKHFSILGGAAATMSLLWGCASIGNPSGGPRDEDPPRFVSANPKPGSVNVDPSNIYIDFNELVNVKDAFEKVVLSPPGKSTPRVSTRGRRVVVNITDTLLPNTTYTIDFGDAIEDNNESNKLSAFAYTFSTGPTLDSLRISGMVLGAEDMEPQQGVFVGAYISKEDSAFTRMPFERLARTDEYGRFVIRGLQDTTYRLFALKDLDNDRHYANPEEDIALYDGVVRPTCERITAYDTVRNLYTGTIDTIVERQRTRFLPNNILLRMFNTGLKTQYLVSYTRPDSARLEFIFNAPDEKQPRISLVDDATYPSPLRAERSVGNDSLTIWLPRDLAMRDTLQLALEYTRTDLATGLKSDVNDTVKLIKPKSPQKTSKAKKKKKTETPDSIASEAEKMEELPPPPTFKFTVAGSETDVTRPLSIEVPVPLMRLDTLAFRLEMKPDTVWLPVKGSYKIEKADSLSDRRFRLEFPWQRDMSYRLTADSVAAVSLYGAESEKLSYEFKTKPEDELSNLKITISGLDPEIPAFVQLMASGDKPKYTAPVTDGYAMFKGIDAGKYYARIYEDFNGDGKFTTGSYRMQRVFGEPIPTDTITSQEAETEHPDYVTETTADSISIQIPDSIDISAVDSVDMSVPDRSLLPPTTDKDAVRRLVDMGYSLSPTESDSIGTDILIAIGPDLVYYYPKTINVKKNWDVEQTWNVFETALDLQKPDKIKKNKPKRNNNLNKNNSNEEEEEEEDEFGVNPFDPNRRNDRNNRRGF